jgi:hypothetical protein
MAVSAPCVDHGRKMSDRGFHYIQDDLSETWLEDWAGAGVGEMEAYLAKHAAFREFLETDEASA